MSKTRNNGEGSIRQRADGRWEVRISGDYDFRKGGYQRISRYAETQEEAVAMLHSLSYMMNTYPQQNKGNMKLGDWLDLWLTVLFGSEETNRQMSGEYDQNQPEKKKPLPKLFQPL